MDFSFSNLKGWLLVAGVTAASFAQAQTWMPQGQPILFSAPDDGDVVSNAPSLSSQPPATPVFEGLVHAPGPGFNFKTPAATSTRLPAPVSAPTISADEADRRVNWALMTPAEILGVATPEEALNIPQSDAAGQPENPTAVERFYERQNQMQTNAAGFLPDTASVYGGFQDDFQDGEAGRLNANVFNPSGGEFGNPAQSADTFQTPAPNNGAASGQNGDGGWSKIFISAETKPAQSPAQVEDMAEFQKLLEPSQPSKSSSDSSGDGLFSVPQTPTFGRPLNPAGLSGQFNNGIGGYPALPSGVGQNDVPAVTAVPDWKPQLPPWMLRGPQPGVFPKRVVF
jgi:hypothetical protein